MDADSSDRLFSLIGNALSSTNVTDLNSIPDRKLILNLIILLILIFVNAIFSASEMAVITLNDNKVRLQAEAGDKRARRILRFMEKPTNFLSTIQVGITFAGFLASALMASKFIPSTVEWFKAVGRNFTGLETLIMVLYTIILSYISLVCGELVPKRFAMHSPEKVLKFTAGILVFFEGILKPFVFLLTLSTSMILKIFGIKGDLNDKTVTEEEIRMMVNVGREKGTIHEDEKEMIENIFELDDTQISEVMTHRTNLVSLDIEASFDEVLKVSVSEKFTRIPVYKDSIDNIVGILHTKDLLTLAIEGLKQPYSLSNMIREPFFLPETKAVDKAFREMQSSHAQIAVVIDEYGGTAGIVTMEDILEEIVGNMQDEYDEETDEIIKLDDTTFIVDGSTSLDELSDELNMEFPEDRDYDTLAGLVLNYLGRIPDEDENAQVNYLNLVLTVTKMEDKRISEIKVDILPEEDKEEDEEKEKEKEKGLEEGTNDL